MKKTIMAIAALLIALCIVSCGKPVNDETTTADITDITASDTAETESGETSDTEDNSETEEQKVYPHTNMELAPLDEIIATTDNMSFKVSTLKYFFMDEYSAFVNQYYYQFSYYNFDINIPLHDQEYVLGSEPVTWYNLFLNEAKNNFEQYAVFSEMAHREGIELDSEDNEKIESNLDSIEKAAADYSQTFEEYISQFMGEGMTRERIKAVFEMMQLGHKFYLKLYNKPVYTSEQIEEAYENANGEYSLVDYREAQIYVLYDETDTDEQIEAAKKEAASKAGKMKELIDGGKSFTEAYNAVSGSSDSTGTETGDVYLHEGAGYSNQERYEFLYDKKTVEGQVNVSYDEQGNAYVVQCVKLPYKDTQRSVSVRHILLSSSDYSTEEEAYAAGLKLLNQINEAEDKKAEFIKLVPEYSSDPGSNTNGGLYENVVPGAMVEQFNDWCFDSDWKIGDTGLVLTDYGYHVMYLDGFSDEMWYYNCESALRSKDFNNAAEQIFETVKVTYNEDLLDRLEK